MEDRDANNAIDTLVGIIEKLEDENKDLFRTKEELESENERLNEKLSDTEMELEDIRNRFEL